LQNFLSLCRVADAVSLKDRYGVSKQIVRKVLPPPQLLSDLDPEKSRRVMQALLQMVKLDIVGLERVYDGKTPSE
jgi:predicted 3-demethylubiquinone-9 3-methyltransferase (glyoxalase superfamily)